MSQVRRFDHVGLTVADLDVVTAEQCLKPVDLPGMGCTFPVTES